MIQNKLLNNVNNLSNCDYVPNGSTALFDAIGDTVNWFRNEKNVLMVIVTDGQENASKKYNRSEINAMIEDKKKHNDWSYVYLSSDLSTELQGNNLGLKTSYYTSNCQVVQDKFGDFVGKKLSSALTNYRKKGVSVQSQLNK